MILFKADRLIELRKKKGLYQKDIANHFGIERTAYGKYENKGIQPPPDMIVKLADFFDVSTDYLLGRTDELKPELPKNTKTELPPDFSYSFYTGYKELDDDNRALLHDLMEKMRLSQKAKGMAQD